MKDKNKQSRRFGFVKLSFTGDIDTNALLGIEPFDTHVIDGKQVECKLAVPKDPVEEAKKLEVKRQKKMDKRMKKLNK